MKMPYVWKPNQVWFTGAFYWNHFGVYDLIINPNSISEIEMYNAAFPIYSKDWATCPVNEVKIFFFLYCIFPLLSEKVTCFLNCCRPSDEMIVSRSEVTRFGGFNSMTIKEEQHLSYQGDTWFGVEATDGDDPMLQLVSYNSKGIQDTMDAGIWSYNQSFGGTQWREHPLWRDLDCHICPVKPLERNLVTYNVISKLPTSN